MVCFPFYTNKTYIGDSIDRYPHNTTNMVNYITINNNKKYTWFGFQPNG